MVMKLKDAYSLLKSYDKPKEHIKKQRLHFANKGPNMFFSCSDVRMWELYHKESWTPKNWCFQTLVLEKPLDENEREE